MKIHNVHERSIVGSMASAAELLDSLAGPNDKLWPHGQWPPMKLDAQLTVGSAGGHGPVRYRVSEYDPGRKVAFSFDNSGIAAGMVGGHYFEICPNGDRLVIRHVLTANCNFGKWLHWAVIIRPLHDALLEDALDRAESAMNLRFLPSTNWGPWVRFLRFLVKRAN